MKSREEVLLECASSCTGRGRDALVSLGAMLALYDASSRSQEAARHYKWISETVDTEKGCFFFDAMDPATSTFLGLQDFLIPANRGALITKDRIASAVRHAFYDDAFYAMVEEMGSIQDAMQSVATTTMRTGVSQPVFASNRCTYLNIKKREFQRLIRSVESQKCTQADLDKWIGRWAKIDDRCFSDSLYESLASARSRLAVSMELRLSIPGLGRYLAKVATVFLTSCDYPWEDKWSWLGRVGAQPLMTCHDSDIDITDPRSVKLAAEEICARARHLLPMDEAKHCTADNLGAVGVISLACNHGRLRTAWGRVALRKLKRACDDHIEACERGFIARRKKQKTK